MPATRITVLNNGSLRVEGDFEIVDAAGAPFGLAGRTKVSLCRCGQSKNKPFCDSSHKQCAFESTIVAFDLPAPAAPAVPMSAAPAAGGAPASSATAAPTAPPATTPGGGSAESGPKSAL
jgi:CDGSH-type Zn-finger protein